MHHIYNATLTCKAHTYTHTRVPARPHTHTYKLPLTRGHTRTHAHHNTTHTQEYSLTHTQHQQQLIYKATWQTCRQPACQTTVHPHSSAQTPASNTHPRDGYRSWALPAPSSSIGMILKTQSHSHVNNKLYYTDILRDGMFESGMDELRRKDTLWDAVLHVQEGGIMYKPCSCMYAHM